ncbi:MAG TPA: alpha/beta hydrolase [Pseudonocardiaceae bacterium]|nr:alpha/beta hydrolase [Pseudonocardiaceae bacterium]
MTGGSATAGAPDVETRGPAGPVPAGLAKFYGQTLAWGGCSGYATDDNAAQAYNASNLQCTRLTVPLDYTKPQGTTITLGVMRVQATDKATRIGSLLVNPGGPGASGMELAANLAGQGGPWAASPLAKDFDLVGFDPRGIASSQPQIRCLTAAQTDAQRESDLDDDTSPQGVAKYEAQQKAYAAECAQNTKDGKTMLASVGTTTVVKDMDVLRSALGDSKLSYLGYSYGTFLGSTYAEQFPKNVRAMVLDGAVDPTESIVAETVGQGNGFQTAFSQFAQWCAKRQDCALGTDPTKATAAFQSLVNPLLQHPVPVGDGRELSYDDATTGAIQALYSQSYWQYLNTGLDELKQGSGQTLMLLADNYDGRNSDGSYSNEQDAFTAIRCVDDPPVTDASQLLDAAQQYKQAAPFLDDGRPAAAAQDACSYWPVPPTDKPHTPSVAGLAPVLVVSTTNDPATPYQSGVNLANALHGGLLTFEGTQHTAFLQNNACVDKWGSQYLTKLTLPPTGTRCGP